MTDTTQGIVLLGLPRSGTTLLRRLINAHPHISCRSETFVLRSAAQFLAGDVVGDGIDYGVLGGLAANDIRRETVLSELRTFCFSFFETLAKHDGKPRWASKTAVDSFYARQIEQLCGDTVQYVCIVRNGFDSVCSLKELCDANQVFVKELHQYVVANPRLDEAMALSWRDVSSSLFELAERQQGNAILIRYEDLVTQTDKTLADVFEFLGETMPDGIADKALSGDDLGGMGDWKTFSKTKVDATSIGRHSALSEAALSRIAKIINAVSERCGYPSLPCDNIPDADEAMRRYEMAMMMNIGREDDA